MTQLIVDKPTYLDANTWHAFINSIDVQKRLFLDSRPILETGQDPFASIMSLINRLPEDGVLELLTPFEPFPLYRVMTDRGFAILILKEETLFHSGFIHQHSPIAKRLPKGRHSADLSDQRPCHGFLDLIDLPPPQPMVRILEACTFLKPGEELTAHLARMPQLLFPRLKERGLLWQINDDHPARIILSIQRPLK
ncbi:MAG: DUF2249 domain-containing protein [Magnetococcales bacterium]|nr:DUF2249 domain-containing protein [Magnetococcales bacterium]